MSEELLAFLAIAWVLWLVFVFPEIGNDEDGPYPVPECLTPDYYHETSDDNDRTFATMQLLYEKNWTDVQREEHFWTDDIYATCKP